MDFWTRLFPGLTDSQKKHAAPKPNVHDPQARLGRFRRVYNSFVELCNRPRNPTSEGPLLDSIHAHLDRIAALLREESRVPSPHTCVQFAGGDQIYAAIARAASASQYEPVIRGAIAVFSALVDSEEQDFLASGHFAKSMMRFIQKVLESEAIPYDSETETAVLELLFTVAARIRLQPEILPVWFHSTARPELEDVFVKEKKTFVGITQKDDFPLCYLLMDRVHRQGRTGDFARTGLLYVFEATGRSLELEEWVVSSDLSTLMASGLGALYSSLSRELSILHPDATLPAVLAMSDYSTMHHRATAESAFSEGHKAHMATFLLYLAFWQDILDHCRSDDVKQTLLDHFQILFLQQLLYPSLLQSSDTDAGSSIAVLTYMSAILEALEYPELVNIILTYLLALDDDEPVALSAPETPSRPPAPPRSPTSVRRRQSLLLLNAPKDPENAVDPKFFNLGDLIFNNMESQNSQAVFAAFKLAAVLFSRQRTYVFRAIIKVQRSKCATTLRSAGTLEIEIQKYSELAMSLHPHYSVDATYQGLCHDIRNNLETQMSNVRYVTSDGENCINKYNLISDDIFLRTATNVLRTFFTNNVDVNLALTEAIVSLAKCPELHLDGWIALLPLAAPADGASSTLRQRPWQAYLDEEESSSWTNMQRTTSAPIWDDSEAPTLYKILITLASQLEGVRRQVPNLDQLLAGRKNMLQAASLETSNGEPSVVAMMHDLEQTQYLAVPSSSSRRGRSSSRGDEQIGVGKVSAIGSFPSSVVSSAQGSRATSSRRGADGPSSPSSSNNLFRPPPPETPSTTDILMRIIQFNGNDSIVQQDEIAEPSTTTHKATLNHVLSNAVILQEFVLELVAVLQVRAAVFGPKEIVIA